VKSRQKKKTTNNRKSPQNGYFLIDVVVALFIMTIAFVSILTGFVFAGKVAGDSLLTVKKIVVEKSEFEKLPRYPAP
jgi:hypothetical protein